ncbi:MAG: AMP-binding protein [Deltaproteobacteria bacterium]|nr:AMP-binding protein [Deltaproteobacteria bacterium]MBW2414300.1 AMP-binding protein [Deltaproteobacteria bacterium]
MPDILSVHAQAHGDKLAVIDDRPDGTVIQWTFAELEAEACRLANVLLELGAHRGDRVVWCGQNSTGIVRVMHAARKIGAIAVPLNYRLSPEEAAYVVDNSDAEIAYVDSEFAALFEEIRPQTPKLREVLVFDGPGRPGMQSADERLGAASAGEPQVADSEGAAGTMIYTSGTTGKPKGAVRKGAADPEPGRKLLELLGYTADDIYLTTGPLYHSGPGGFMAIAHGLGNTAVVQRKFDPADWLRLVDKYRVTSTFSAPTPIRMVCRLDDEIHARYDTTSLSVMIANAAPWSFALKQAYLDKFPADSLYEVYGSTELGVNTVLLPEDQLRKPGSCGKPAPGVEIVLLDDDGREVTEPQAPGEVFIRSRNIFSTYHKAQDKYEEDRRGDLQTVGDVAYFDDEGYYFICDRKKDMIISGGMNIYPAEIEAALEHHAEIHDAAVFGVPSEDWGESVHAELVLNAGSTLDEAGVIAYAREHLASYKIPRSVAFRDEIPRTGSGKILKRVLREPYWRGHESGVL